MQFTESFDNGATWSKFQLINIQKYTLRKENNIYLFDVVARDDALIARYPAVFQDEGGIYQSESTDGRGDADLPFKESQGKSEMFIFDLPCQRHDIILYSFVQKCRF